MPASTPPITNAAPISAATSIGPSPRGSSIFLLCRKFLIQHTKDNAITRLGTLPRLQPVQAAQAPKTAPENSDPDAIDAAFDAAVDDAFKVMPARS
jgi:hypothetical protein